MEGSVYMGDKKPSANIDDDYKTLLRMRNDENMQSAVRVGVVVGIALPILAKADSESYCVINTLQLLSTLQMMSNPDAFTTALEMVKGGDSSDSDKDNDYWNAIGSILDGVEKNG